MKVVNFGIGNSSMIDAGTTQLTSHTSGCMLIEAKALYEKLKK